MQKQRILGIDPGSVSLLAVVNDSKSEVEIILDEEIWKAKHLLCHPLVNTSTLVIARDDIQRILEITNHRFQVLSVPGTG